MSLGFLHFLSPYWLLGLGLLPAFWWLLRSLPPLPRRIKFPAIALLRDLVPEASLTSRAPWWLLLLRLSIVAGVIFYLAQPVVGVMPPVSYRGDLLLVIDNDWAAARDWSARTNILQSLIKAAVREHHRVILLPTAGQGDDAQPIAMDAAEAEQKLGAIQPQPWGADWVAAGSKLHLLDTDAEIGQVVWLSSGLGGQAALNFHEVLRRFPRVDVVGTQSPIILLRSVTEDQGQLQVRLDSSPMGAGNGLGNGPSAGQVEVEALNEKGGILARSPLTLNGGGGGQASLALPPDLRPHVRRVTVGMGTAGQSWLFDSSGQKKLVGIVGDQAALRQASYLSPVTYLARALQPMAAVRVAAVSDLMTAQPSLIVLPDGGIAESALTDLLNWVRAGGTLIRFADEAENTDSPTWHELSPVTVRKEQRALGGNLSWDKPEKLQPFTEASPFYGLAIPPDVVVNRQWLAEPDSIPSNGVWAQLQDGTPLITTKIIGQGRSVLVHVPARPGWSNLPLSGLFVDILHRVLDLSATVGASVRQVQPQAMLAPLAVMDGFGVLHAAQNSGLNNLQALPVSGEEGWIPSARHPPGLYGVSTQSHAYNLGAALPPLALLADRLDVRPYMDTTAAQDLGGYFLTFALLLLVLDALLSLYLRGLLAGVGRGWLAALLLATIFCAPPALAKEKSVAVDDLSATTHLGYVRTGDSAVDRVSEAGLRTLARVISRRTLIQPLDVRAVDVERDDLVFYPLLYWPLTGGGRAISAEAAARVNAYLHHHGMILFDNLGDTPLPLLRQQKLAGIDLPVLERLPEGHVLGRSFYLLSHMVGRYDHPDFWIEPEATSSGDGVASVLLGDNHFAEAWAADENGRFLYPCTPNGETQRDYAFRFGVNVVMLALTGNYKSDQVHAETLLQRLGR